MPRIRVRYQGGVLVPLEELDLKDGEILEIEIKDKLSNKLRDFVGIVKKESSEKLEEAYCDYVLERTGVR
jgi:predicted DNA-binding antitoxin AbrB/MazE fold protein